MSPLLWPAQAKAAPSGAMCGCGCQHTGAEDVATVLAAQTITPGDARDLSYVLEACGGPRQLRRGPAPADARVSGLVNFIRSADTFEPAIAQFTTLVTEWTDRIPDLRIVLVTDSCYPAALATAYDRPPALFVRGCLEWLSEDAVAVVGSRATDDDGLAATFDVARTLAKSGVTVVSGLAAGVDTAAHEGALSVGGRTAAVVATGVDEVYPAENADLADRVRRDGVLLSQFLPATPSTWSTFLLRNAVISGLSRVSVIMNGAARSGTYDEAHHALKQGRPIAFWRPAMASEQWARDLVEAGAARFVDDAHGVLDLLATT